MGGTLLWPVWEVLATWRVTRAGLWSWVYRQAARHEPESYRFMNWGLVEEELPRASLAEDPERVCAHLVHRVAALGAVGGADVLDLGCGRGGGAAYVRRVLGPRRVVGVDRCERALQEARRRYAGEPGLEFVRASIEEVPFQDRCFDVAICIDTSHCCPDVGRLLDEARRLLRPGGQLLLADLREDWSPDEEQMLQRGFELDHVEDWSPHVVAALEQDARRRARLCRSLPLGLRGAGEVLVGLPGTPVHRGLVGGWLQYMVYRLIKSDG